MKLYLENDLHIEGASTYSTMHQIGVKPDNFTYPIVVKACGELDDLWVGSSVHAHVLQYGFDFDFVVRTELMIMYVKFGELGSADYLFETMTGKDLVAWNALITAYVQNGLASKSLNLFHQMGSKGVKPDSVTIVGTMSACAQLGCLEMGENIYDFARKQGIIVDSSTIVSNARLDMYMKCGSIDMAQNLFNEMPQKSVISWSTMIVGYAFNGYSKKALDIFAEMQIEGVKPNYVTFLGVLSACSHGALVKEGWIYFEYMNESRDKNIRPRKEHYACMVDLLGRSGQLEEAYKFIKSMPIEPDSAIWGALLGACSIHHNIKLGQHVADLLFKLAPEIGSYHVLISNMYASAGRWNCVKKVRRRMRQRGIKKVAAYSYVEFNGELHGFYGGDKSHPQSKIIYGELEKLIKELKIMGYAPKTDSVFHDVDMEEKEATLSTHSEKLAIVFGIINIRPDHPIRVMKNLRACDDCHNFCKSVTKYTMREIVMRDKNRFHHFKNGVCSCNDFW